MPSRASGWNPSSNSDLARAEGSGKGLDPGYAASSAVAEAFGPVGVDPAKGIDGHTGPPAGLDQAWNAQRRLAGRRSPGLEDGRQDHRIQIESPGGSLYRMNGTGEQPVRSTSAQGIRRRKGSLGQMDSVSTDTIRHVRIPSDQKYHTVLPRDFSQLSGNLESVRGPESPIDQPRTRWQAGCDLPGSGKAPGIGEDQQRRQRGLAPRSGCPDICAGAR